jgi:hypothetical protein
MASQTQKIIDDLDFASNRLSEQVRTIAFGVLAIAWVFLAGGSDAPAVKVAPEALALLCAAGGAIAVLLADYFQFLCAYCLSARLLKEAEARPKVVPKYKYNSFLYLARNFFFWLKQLICIASVIVLLYAIVGALFVA